jgi:FtsZ-binding cell division protein ZapB
MEIDESLIKNELLLCHEYDEMEKGIADRDVYIIVLQMKLLAEKEEVEKLKTKMQELEHKNENMARDLRRVSQNYNQERLVVVEAAVMAGVVLMAMLVLIIVMVMF